MVRKWWRRISATFAAAAAVVLVSAGTAHAASWDVFVETFDSSGLAYWTENGDTLDVCDIRADGFGVRGYIYLPNASDPANGTVLFKGNDPSSAGDCTSFTKNIAENIPLGIKVCNYRGSDVVDCGWKWAR